MTKKPYTVTVPNELSAAIEAEKAKIEQESGVKVSSNQFLIKVIEEGIKAIKGGK